MARLPFYHAFGHKSHGPAIDLAEKLISLAPAPMSKVIVAERCGSIQQEMGRKRPLIVLDDADLENAVDCAIGGWVLSTGQRCTSNTRVPQRF